MAEDQKGQAAKHFAIFRFWSWPTSSSPTPREKKAAQMARALVALLLNAAGSMALSLDACPVDRCGPAPAAGACPSATAPSATTQPGGSQERLFFRNEAAVATRLARVDEDGGEHDHALLPPGGRITVDTAQGVVWRARAATSNRLLVEHKVSPVQIDACQCPPRVAPSCNRPPFRGYRTTWDPVVFENNSPLPVSLEWYDGECVESLQVGSTQTLPPFASVRFIATYGHTFRVRASDSGLLLREHTIGDVVIRGCDEREPTAAPAADGPLAATVAEAEAEADGEAYAAASAALIYANNALRLQLATALHELTSLSAAASNGTALAPMRTASAVAAGAAPAAAVDRALSAELLAGLRMPLVGGSSA